MGSLAQPLEVAILDTFLPHIVVDLVKDGTVTEHPGRKVFGKGRYCDAKRSSHSSAAHMWRAQAGRPGDHREADRRGTIVGVAGGGRALSKRQGQPGRWSKTQDSQRPDAATAVRAAALVSHATVFAGDGGYANHMWSAALPERDRQKNRSRLGPANDRDFLRRDHARLPRFVVSPKSSNPCIQADHAKILPSNKTPPVNTDPMVASRDKPLRQFGHLGVGTVALR